MIQTWSRDGRALGHGLVLQTIETMANIRDPALEIVNNINRKEILLVGPIRSQSGFKNSLIWGSVFSNFKVHGILPTIGWNIQYPEMQHSVSPPGL